MQKHLIAIAYRVAHRVRKSSPHRSSHALPSYYRITNETPKDVALRYVKYGDKIRGYLPHAIYHPDTLWPLREVTRTRENSWPSLYGETGEEKWDRLKRVFQRQGWDPKDPLYLFVGENGKVMVGEGNHRLAIARELGMTQIPVVFEFRKRVEGGVQLIKV